MASTFHLTLIDWLLILGVNGAVVGYGIASGRRHVHRAVDWFLAARALPWWAIGLSMFATAVDSGDYVVVAGGAYKYGLSNLAFWWLGISIGWMLTAFFVFVPMYRYGMYTNAEYLERRFGPFARVFSVAVQILYRTNIIGNATLAISLTLEILTGAGSEARWTLCLLFASVAAIYTAVGGLRSVVITDVIQVVVMFVASFVLYLVVADAVGGWGALSEKLAALGEDLPDRLMHVSGNTIPPPEDGSGFAIPGSFIFFIFLLVIIDYCLVNHSQSMRMLGARSVWDMKLSAVVAGAVTSVVLWCNVSLGVYGRALFPEIEYPDHVLPSLMGRFLPPGLLGLVVTGIVAAGLSTYDSIGSALASLFVRDIYARFFRPHADDAHYLRSVRIMSILFVFAGLAYVPFLLWFGTILDFYLKLTGVFVVPLAAIYAMGIFTRVHPKAGAWGLVAGAVYGSLSLLLGDILHVEWVPYWFASSWLRYVVNFILPCTVMWGASFAYGRRDRGWSSASLRGLVMTLPDTVPEPLQEIAQSRAETAGAEGWLERTGAAARQPEVPFEVPATGLPLHRRPGVWALGLLGLQTLATLLLW